MNTFFKVFFACLLAIISAGVLMIIVLVGMAGIITSSEKPTVKPNTVLFIDISEPVLEQGRDQDINPMNFSFESIAGLQERIGAVRHAIGDSSVKALYLLCTGNAMGFAASQEFGAIIDSFKASGKPVITFADAMSQRAYEIAHRGSHVFVQPNGMVEWVGYHIEVLFLKNLLDKIAVKPEVFYAGQFKSATEPFRLTKMSDPNRIQYQAFLNRMYGNIIQSIVRHRGVDSSTLSQYANELSVRTSEQAFAKGLIDGVFYDDQVRDTIKALVGLKRSEDISFMKIGSYYDVIKKVGLGDRIAVVYADGGIVGGEGQDDEIGSDSYRSLLSKLRKDKKVKAVVLRVNSPGGSALASEMIWRELEMLKKEKPLVVSMGDYAASGGYYIACGADSIFALPNTLTGSIGVFSVYIDAQKMFNDKLGITFDGVSTNTYSDFGNIGRPMSGFEKQIAQQDVDSIYVTFKNRVAKGRDIPGTRVDKIAQGRIWSGSDAVELGLVDKLGTLDDAIACAARLAGLEKYSIRKFPAIPTFLEKILGEKEDVNTTNLSQLSRHISAQHLAWIREYQNLQKLSNRPQARLPFLLQHSQ